VLEVSRATDTHALLEGDLGDAPSAGNDHTVEEAGRGEGTDEAPDEPEAEDTRFKRGQLVEGTISETSPNEVLIDLGEGIIGVVPSRELGYLDRPTLESLQVGSPIRAYVLRAKSESGRPVLSIHRALEEQDWQMAEEYAQNKGVYEGRVAGYNKGGLIVRFGRLRGFIPASQISPERENRPAEGEGDPDQRWSGLLNEEIMVKVVEVNRTRNRLILSERAATRESRERQKQRLISELQVGEIRTGRVISLTDFGAFVDLGGADGLIHLTELSWKHVNHPKEILSVGQEVSVKVISVDPERRRIGLSMRSLEEDPWMEVVKGFQENQLVQGRITKITRFGAFASLVNNADIEGLIHVSELADYRVEHPRDVVAVGDVLTLRVLKIDNERRRLGLSLKRVNSAKYMNDDWSRWNP
jgi:small subunit ribosomal protein S1